MSNHFNAMQNSYDLKSETECTQAKNIQKFYAQGQTFPT